MKYQGKSKKIYINEREKELLALISSGFLGNKSLMNKKDCEREQKLPFCLNFSPNNKQNKAVVNSLKKGDSVELICDLNSSSVGEIKITETWKDEKSFLSLFSLDHCLIDYRGDTCIAGDVSVYKAHILSLAKQFARAKKHLNAQKITAVFFCANPLTRAHERILRWTIDKSDLVLVFLVEDNIEQGLDFNLKKNSLEFLAKNYLPEQRVFIADLRHINIFKLHINPIFQCNIAKGFGATKLVVGQNHSGLGLFLDKNHFISVLDEHAKNLHMELIILPELVFCNQCMEIVSTRSCPHGAHHHIRYNSSALRAMLFSGIMPPEILMRKEITAQVLASIFKNRLKDISSTLDSMLPNIGIVRSKKDEELYVELLSLYQGF